MSSDVDQITPKVFEAVDESSQVHWEKLNAFHEQQYQTCWNRFGVTDLTCQQTYPKVSRSLDLEERRLSVNNLGEGAHVGPHNHREQCSICNTGCHYCEQDYVVEKWQYQVRQDGGQGCQNWLHHHENVLLEPSYLLTDSDANTRHPNEEASWNVSRGNKHQNPRVHRGDGKGFAFLKDVKLKRLVRANNSAGLQCRDCRTLDKNIQAFPSGAIAEVEQQQPARDLGRLEGQNRSMEERVDSVSTETQILIKEDEEAFDSVSAKTRNFKKEKQEAISGILQEDTSRAYEFSQQTHLHSHRFSMPAEDLETYRGYQERDQHLHGKLGSDQDSICLSLLREFRGRKKKSDNVPAEEAFYLCSLWTLAKLKSRMECCTIHSDRDCLKYGTSMATKCPELLSQPHVASRAEVATQTDSCPESCTDHKIYGSNTFQHICLLWVFVILRIAAPGRGSSNAA